MKHSKTLRPVAVAVAAVLAFGIAPLAAGAEEPTPTPTAAEVLEAAASEAPAADETVTPEQTVAPEEAAAAAALLGDETVAEDPIAPAEAEAAAQAAATENDHALDQAESATNDAPAVSALDGTDAVTTAAAVPATPDAAWDIFRVMNTRRIAQGGSPWVMNPSLKNVAYNWLTPQTGDFPTKDPDLVNKVPGTWTVAWQNTAWAIAPNATEAVKALTPDLQSADLAWGNSTDIGIAITSTPWSGSYKLYSFYFVAVDYPHTTAQSGEMTLFRFFRPSTGTHFYSASASERNSVAKNSAYRYEGQVAYVLKPTVATSGTSNLNRFYQPSSGTHFYTSSVSEYNRVRTFPQYSLDGVAGKVYTRQASGVIPMYRFFRPASGTHFYTASTSERDSVRNQAGYNYEGVAFFLRKAS